MRLALAEVLLVLHTPSLLHPQHGLGAKYLFHSLLHPSPSPPHTHTQHLWALVSTSHHA